MISIILYGRNDAHGYNLHRRAALSLNCLAEVLSRRRRRDRLRRLQHARRAADVRRGVRGHPDRPVPLTAPGLPGARRASSRAVSEAHRPPRGRAGLPKRSSAPCEPGEPVAPVHQHRHDPDAAFGESLSDVCRDLVDGFYALPRFELPEWLWEQLPRSDPRSAIAEVRRLGPLLHLDESSPESRVGAIRRAG